MNGRDWFFVRDPRTHEVAGICFDHGDDLFGRYNRPEVIAELKRTGWVIPYRPQFRDADGNLLRPRLHLVRASDRLGAEQLARGAFYDLRQEARADSGRVPDDPRDPIHQQATGSLRHLFTP
ncbi:MAG: hypothetical protein E6J20_19680 [Chloroflexi bacterium]|nr:MAG: hypothetical protein E6J20_19680 [Chloroflexota bacterium]